MKHARSPARPAPSLSAMSLALLVAAMGIGCETPSIDTSEEAAAAVREQSLGGFPYHPVLFHLDLSIFAYQLYNQTLAWPFDPYYEDLDNGAGDRAAFMDRVRAWAVTTGADQVAAGTGLEAYRGPGVLTGFPDNPAHDPIVYQYSRLHPWSTSIANPLSRWTEYRTPTTSQIRDVYVCSRSLGQPEGTVSIEALPARRDDTAPGARDVLMVFEGGTGDKGEGDEQPPSHSLMGFVLLRAKAGDAYDIHIAFRGSRSGSGARAAFQALSDGAAQGNPDWISDLGYNEVAAPDITTIGEVSRGMSRSLETIFPQLYLCLEQVVGLARTTPPENIYVTGHSLGGGLAQHFVSALFLGNVYGPRGEVMPPSIRAWPWERLKLITFSAPRVGNEEWAETLTTEHLDSAFFVSRPGNPYDVDAIGITGRAILPRLLDPAHAAAYRVLVPTDPITTDRIPGGKHVGQTVYLEEPSAWDAAAGPDFDAHDPVRVRQLAVDTLRDDRIPATAWTYRELAELDPERDDSAAGTAAEYGKLADVVRSYYTNGDIWFDRAAFDVGFETFLARLGEL